MTELNQTLEAREQEINKLKMVISKERNEGSHQKSRVADRRSELDELLDVNKSSRGNSREEDDEFTGMHDFNILRTI